jgi:hypothetical protein
MNKKTRNLAIFITCLILGLTITTKCALAQPRVFADLSLQYVGEYQLPKQQFQDTPVGGLSGITYDKKSDRFYVISDDRSNLAPARFYTLKLDMNDQGIKNVTVEKVTFLKDKKGQKFPPNTIDTEGIAVTPSNTVFISSEGDVNRKIDPFVKEFSLKTGQEINSLQIPKRYLPDGVGEKQTKGIQNNLAFEGLTLNLTGNQPAKGEPFRLFTITESSLIQDEDDKNSQPKSRLLHYLISDGQPILIAEHLYKSDLPPTVNLKQGVSEILSIDQDGHFLSIERSLTLLGFNVKIYQFTLGGATDTSSYLSLKGVGEKVQPIQKKLLLDLNELPMTLDNLEGMTFGPRLPDGSQSLILVSDNNFSDDQITQFLLFKLKFKQ